MAKFLDGTPEDRVINLLVKIHNLLVDLNSTNQGGNIWSFLQILLLALILWRVW